MSMNPMQDACDETAEILGVLIRTLFWAVVAGLIAGYGASRLSAQTFIGIAVGVLAAIFVGYVTLVRPPVIVRPEELRSSYQAGKFTGLLLCIPVGLLWGKDYAHFQGLLAGVLAIPGSVIIGLLIGLIRGDWSIRFTRRF